MMDDGIKIGVLIEMQKQIHEQMIYWTKKYNDVTNQIDLIKEKNGVGS